jgi:hypothetical protein
MGFRVTELVFAGRPPHLGRRTAEYGGHLSNVAGVERVRCGGGSGGSGACGVLRG